MKDSILGRFARLNAVAAVALLLLAADPAPGRAQAIEGLRVEAAAGGVATLAGEATSTQPWAYIGANGPLAIGTRAPLRIFASLGLTAAPGEAVELSSVETFRGARVDLGLEAIVGAVGDYRTSLVLSSGYLTRLNAGDLVPTERFARHLGIGLSFQASGRRALLRVLVGCDEVSGPCATEGDPLGRRMLPRHAMLKGSLPIPGTKNLALLQASTSLRIRDRSGPGRDVMTVGVLFDVAEAIR